MRRPRRTGPRCTRAAAHSGVASTGTVPKSCSVPTQRGRTAAGMPKASSSGGDQSRTAGSNSRVRDALAGSTQASLRRAQALHQEAGERSDAEPFVAQSQPHGGQLVQAPAHLARAIVRRQRQPREFPYPAGARAEVLIEPGGVAAILPGERGAQRCAVVAVPAADGRALRGESGRNDRSASRERRSTTSRAAVRSDCSSSAASCSTRSSPVRRVLIGTCAVATSRPSESNRTARLDVPPWSSARYSARDSPGGSSSRRIALSSPASQARSSSSSRALMLWTRPRHTSVRRLRTAIVSTNFAPSSRQ